MIRAFVGGEDRDSLISLPDEELIQIVMDDLVDLMKINEEPLFLNVTGMFDARSAGIDFSAPPDVRLDGQAEVRLEPGLYTLSINFLCRNGWISVAGDDMAGDSRSTSIDQYEGVKKVGRVGYSIYIYSVPP